MHSRLLCGAAVFAMMGGAAAQAQTSPSVNAQPSGQSFNNAGARAGTRRWSWGSHRNRAAGHPKRSKGRNSYRRRRGVPKSARLASALWTVLSSLSLR